MHSQWRLGVIFSQYLIAVGRFRRRIPSDKWIILNFGNVEIFNRIFIRRRWWRCLVPFRFRPNRSGEKKKIKIKRRKYRSPDRSRITPSSVLFLSTWKLIFFFFLFPLSSFGIFYYTCIIIIHYTNIRIYSVRMTDRLPRIEK